MKSKSYTNVHSLLCHRDVEMALTCLGSLLRFSLEPIQMVIHDDGSLTCEDKSRLLNELKYTKIVSRNEADELMNQQLYNYPNCRRYRTDSVFGLKMLDIPLMSQENIAYCDSDILFLRPFRELFYISDPTVSALFMQDTQEPYSLSFKGMIKSGSKLASRVNAGLIFIRKGTYDLDFAEWFLNAEEFKFIPYFTEQTFWAAFGQKFKCRHNR
jgi:lipopolysaccharide biosynthesis glycosyltransferase